MDEAENFSHRFIQINETSIQYLNLFSDLNFLKSDSVQDGAVKIVFVFKGEVETLEGKNFAIKNTREDSTLKAWLCASAHEYSIETRPETALIIAAFPSQILKEFGISNYPSFFTLNYTEGLLNPACSFLESVSRLEMPLPSITMYFVEKLIHEMLGGLLLENLGIAKGGASRRSLFDQAMALIVASAEDPALNPQSLANSLSVSLRQLQRDFKKNGLSIADTIKQHRCELAIRLLTDQNLSVLSLSKIAEYAGFRSVVQLRRALNSLGFKNPTQYRGAFSYQVENESGSL